MNEVAIPFVVKRDQRFATGSGTMNLSSDTD